MKILLINLWRTINSTGGTEKVFFDMANALVQRGYGVTALAFDNTPGNPFFHVDEKVKFINAGVGFVEKNTFLYRVKRVFQGSKEKRHLYDIADTDRQKAEVLAPIIEKERPDIIISYNVEATRIIMNLLKVKCPVITMFHMDPDSILKDSIPDTIRALEKSVTVQVLLPSYINITRRYINNKNIIYIPNCVPQYNIPYKNERSNIIINVARFDGNQKRQHLLIEAFNAIKNNISSDWSIELWGENNFEPDYFDYCVNLVKKHSLEHRVKFCGTTSSIKDKLIKAKIFAFPSAFEGFSLAMTEAMSAGLPVIGYKSCTSVKDMVVHNFNGILCEDGIEDLSNALLTLVNNPNLQKIMGENAKSSMLKYESDKVWDMWENEINKVYREYKQK